ncbi:hypothetical protein EVAR_44211_1 [Eumeta japonica]|uniref:Uncharacterized protein n=1 Tax=Eumeta variegata TaxID=151549 RepID=A0A4C1W0U5_EUMVA|nr:hypothetical protein EVAR_44211_1 [Eumeta japonica]
MLWRKATGANRRRLSISVHSSSTAASSGASLPSKVSGPMLASCPVHVSVAWALVVIASQTAVERCRGGAAAPYVGVRIKDSSPPVTVDDRPAPEAGRSKALLLLPRLFHLCFLGFFGLPIGCYWIDIP